MNVKIEEQCFRFKISEKELKRLLAGTSVHLKTSFLDKTLIVSINPQACGENMEPKLVLDNNDVYLNLCVPHLCAQKLFDLGKSRDGLIQEVNGVAVTLQVNMKEACHT